MTYKTKPSLYDCLIVSRSLHDKFKFMGGEDSQVMQNLAIMTYHKCSLFRIHGDGLYIHEPIM